MKEREKRMISPDSLKGIIVPIVTPLDDHEQLDTRGMRKLIRHILDGGAHGIFCLGTTGELARLEEDTIRNVISVTTEEVAGKVPVFVGVSDCGTRKVLRNMREAEKLGADALVVTLPYYFPVRGASEQFAFFEEILEGAGSPLVLYNMPATIGASIEVPVVEALAQKPNVLGIKDSSGDIGYLRRLLHVRAKGTLCVLVGDERIASAGMAMGACGVVPSLANVFPRLLVGLYEACLRNDAKEAAALQSRIDGINDSLNGCTASWLSSVCWKKKALQMMGICGDTLTAPSLRLPKETETAIQTALAQGDP
jgi:dihydrodipicolinate synthase/N-acetylneuraminate lyase